MSQITSVVVIAVCASWPTAASAFFQDCHFTSPAPHLSLGAQLHTADRLDRAAEAYENYPYQNCFRLGRNCNIEIDSRFDMQVADHAFNECRSEYPTTNPTAYAVFLAERQSFNTCVSKRLRRQAGEIRNAVFNTPETLSLASVLATLENATAEKIELSVEQLAAAATNTTWCPALPNTYRVGILCEGGDIVIGTVQGEKRLKFRLGDGADICIRDFLSPETCHRVTYGNGLFALSPGHPTFEGAFAIKDGVQTGSWQATCASRSGQSGENFGDMSVKF